MKVADDATKVVVRKISAADRDEFSVTKGLKRTVLISLILEL